MPVLWHSQILADQLTLSQPTGWHPQIFRPSDGPEIMPDPVFDSKVLIWFTNFHFALTIHTTIKMDLITIFHSWLSKFDILILKILSRAEISARFSGLLTIFNFFFEKSDFFQISNLRKFRSNFWNFMKILKIDKFWSEISINK